MNKNLLRQISVVIALLATILVNTLANTLPINGQNTGEISDRFDILFVPAGYVFSIWGLIYLALTAYAVFQALPSQRENPRQQKTGWLFVASSAANILWIFLWHYEVFELTLLAMLVILGLLIGIYQKMGIGKDKVNRTEKWLAQMPFSLYLGWISVATIANTSQVLYYLNWNAWGIPAAAWTVILLVIAALLGLTMLFSRRDRVYSLVLVWAFIGIALKHAAVTPVAFTAWGAALVLALLVLASPLLFRRQAALQTGLLSGI